MKAANSPPSLKRNFGWVFAGQMIFTATNWLTVVLLAKLGNASIVGQYSTAVAIVLPIISLSQLMLRSVQTTDTEKEFVFGDYLTLRLITTAVAIVVISGTALLGNHTTDTILCIFAYAATPVFDGIADIYQTYLQKHERMHRNGISMAARGLLNILLLGVTYYFTRSLVWGLVASALSSVVILFGYDQVNARRLAQEIEGHASRADAANSMSPRWQPKTLGRLFRVATPLGISVGLTTLNIYLSRLFVIHYLPVSQVGIFSGITNLMNLGSQALLTISTTVMPRLAKYRASKDTASFMGLILKFGLISAGFGIFALLAAYFFGKTILTICFRPEFAEHNDIFVLTMIAGLIYYLSLPFGTALTAMRVFRSQIWSSALVTIFALAAGFYLVPTFGLAGAAYLTMVAMSVRFVALGVIFFLNRNAVANPSTATK